MSKPQALATEADVLTEARAAVTDQLGSELLLLTGHLDQTITALAGSEPLGRTGPTTRDRWLAALGPEADALTYLAAVRARYPRHVAFRRELDAAARTSTLNPDAPP